MTNLQIIWKNKFLTLPYHNFKNFGDWHAPEERGIDTLKKSTDWLFKEDKRLRIGHEIAFARYKNNKTFAAVEVELEVNDPPE